MGSVPPLVFGALPHSVSLLTASGKGSPHVGNKLGLSDAVGRCPSAKSSKSYKQPKEPTDKLYDYTLWQSSPTVSTPAKRRQCVGVNGEVLPVHWR